MGEGGASAHWRRPPAVDRQLEAAVEAIRSKLGENAVAIYVYGSAVSGGLKPGSDLDVFVVLRRPTKAGERAALFDALTPVSAKRARPAGWRPLEVTAAVRSTLKPLRGPPVTDFQFGEWLRPGLDAGITDPEDPNNADLVLLVAMVRQHGRPLHGPEPDKVIAEVPPDRLRVALEDVVPGLVEDLQTDTANVLLTLARVAYTLTTGAFVPKDTAADWLVPRLSDGSRPALERARDIYLRAQPDTWDGSEKAVPQAVEELKSVIRRASQA
jgi:streptomycin 3"-adenylyltransferase